MNKEEKIKDSKHKEKEFQAMTHFDDPLIPHTCDIQSHNFGDENKMKMIEEMEQILDSTFSYAMTCIPYRYGVDERDVSAKEMATELYEAGCRKIADDEIVIKKGKIDAMIWTVGESAKKLKHSQQKTAREILQDLNDEGYKIYKQQGNVFDADNFNWLIAYAMRKYGIESEGQRCF